MEISINCRQIEQFANRKDCGRIDWVEQQQQKLTELPSLKVLNTGYISFLQLGSVEGFNDFS